MGEGHPAIFRALDKYRQMAEAFSCTDRSKKLARLLNELVGKQHREMAARLRQELALLPPGDKVQAAELIRAIQQLWAPSESVIS